MDGVLGNDVQLTEMENVNSKDDPPQDDICPICLEDYSFPCKANCGHWFCSNCILQYWTYKGIIKPAKCPICKQKVVWFIQHEASHENVPEEEVVLLLNRIEYYNHLHNGGIGGIFLKIRLGFPFLIWSLFTELTEPDRLVRTVMRAHRVLLLFGCISNIYRVGFALMDSSEMRQRTSAYFWVEFYSAIIFCIVLLIGFCRILWLRLSLWLVERRLRQLQNENAQLQARLRQLQMAHGVQ